MNTKQREFYEQNVKTAHNMKREGKIEIALKLEQINQFLKSGKFSQALEWADYYDFPFDFILDMKDIFSGFQE